MNSGLPLPRLSPVVWIHIGEKNFRDSCTSFQFHKDNIERHNVIITAKHMTFTCTYLDGVREASIGDPLYANGGHSCSGIADTIRNHDVHALNTTH